MNDKRIQLCTIFAILSVLTLGAVTFYPKQLAQKNRIIDCTTPEIEKYHNDCLHPCIRYDSLRNGYWMVQSPYHNGNSSIENPILYFSQHLNKWDNGIVVQETHEYGYNSDPNIYIEKDSVFVFWRECGTPLCDSLGVRYATVGTYTKDGIHFTKPKIYLSTSFFSQDIEQSPTLIKWGDRYRFYATWYQYSPERKNKGIAIWEGSSLSNPDFHIIDTIKVSPPITVDKAFQIKIHNKLFFVPQISKFDLWHFDLVEIKGKLLMVASSENGDNIMLGLSDDGKKFKFKFRPLVNNHYMENTIGFRRYYYKPTALVENDSLKVFYTAYDKNLKRNILWTTTLSINQIL